MPPTALDWGAAQLCLSLTVHLPWRIRPPRLVFETLRLCHATECPEFPFHRETCSCHSQYPGLASWSQDHAPRGRHFESKHATGRIGGNTEGRCSRQEERLDTSRGIAGCCIASTTGGVSRIARRPDPDSEAQVACHRPLRWLACDASPSPLGEPKVGNRGHSKTVPA